MLPIQPNVPGREGEEVVLAKDQPQYTPLPVLVMAHPETGSTCLISRWTFTPEERAQIAAGADLWIELLTFGRPAQPIRVGIECPVALPGEPS